MADDDLNDTISTNAAGPRRVRNDEGEVEKHSLVDQIAADKHVKASSALKSPNFGVKFARITPPGTV